MSFFLSYDDFALNESRNDRLVGMLTRECIEAIKKGQTRHVTTFKEWEESVKFTFNFAYTTDFVGAIEGGYFIPKDWKPRGKSEVVISITLGLDKGESVLEYLSIIHYLLKNTISHELEHHAQTHDKFRVPLDRKKAQKLAGTAGAAYLMLPHEIAAFSTGVYAEAKTRKLSFSHLAREAVTKYQEAAQERGEKFSEAEKEKVIAAWEDYARKHTPKAKVIDPNDDQDY